MTDPKVVPSGTVLVCAKCRQDVFVSSAGVLMCGRCQQEFAAAPKQDAGAVDADRGPCGVFDGYGECDTAPPAAAPQQGDGDFLRSLAAGIAGDSPEAVKTRERLLRIAATQQPSGGDKP